MDPALAFEAAEIVKHQGINEAIARGDSCVQQFYDGAVVFITGGSGFLGKQLIEKLLRACKIEKIYVLMRQKKNKTIEERMKILAEDPVFEYLHKVQANFLQKIIPVLGDVTEPNLGITKEKWKSITEEVTIIFHGAATINFADPLKLAALTNIRGTQETIKLGKVCKKLKSYVHISTAYSPVMCAKRIKKPVLEQFYECPVTPAFLMQLVDNINEDRLNTLTPNVIEGWPNTYSFTKALAEEAIRTTAGDLPICIVRPAIVIAALREPLPGWMDTSCAFGPTGFILGAGIGIMHVLYCDRGIHLDFVPVDLVNNALIAAAYETVERRKEGKTDIQIYTVTGTNKPMKFGFMVDTITSDGRKLATDKAVWYAFNVSTKNKQLFILFTWILHYIPGYLVDGVLKLMGKRPLLVKVYDKVYKLNSVLGFYMTNDWQFEDINLQTLYKKLSPADQTIFNFDMGCIDWKHYVLVWCMGMRKYILKDGLNKTNIGLIKQFWFRIINATVLPLYGYTLYKILYLFIVTVFYFFSVFI